MKPKVEVVNIVATGKIGEDIDLKKISKEIRNTKYNPRVFPGLALSVNDPKAVILIFKSGKFVCTGTKCVEDAEMAVRHAISLIREIGLDVRFESIKVQNMVAYADLGFDLNLNAIALAFLENTEYEPEQFPGLFYRIDNPKAVILTFSTGRIVIAGCKDLEDAEKAVEKFCSELSSFGFI